VRVEHALAGVKRARIVQDVLRNTKAQFSDLVMAVHVAYTISGSKCANAA